MKTVDFSLLLRPHLRTLRPYSSARHEFQGQARVMLDANESPYDNGFNRYPDPVQKELRTLIADLKQIATEQLFLGNGSDEAIDLLIRAFCEPGQDNVVVLNPTYGMYEVSAGIHNVEVRKAALMADFHLDVSAVLKLTDEHSKILFLCSPNNPTGNALDRNDMISLIRSFPGLVVVDEAYIDFCADQSLTGIQEEWPNLVILQTLSKAWGLAGLRLGLCIGHPELVGLLNRIKPPYNISAAAQQEGLKQLLRGKEQLQVHVTSIISERELLRTALGNAGAYVFPSDANFLLVRFPDARKVFQHLRSEGIIVRDRSSELHAGNCLRITIGTPEENKLLLGAIRKAMTNED